MLQKAIRRGFPDIVEAAARFVYDKEDKSWLRSRSVVVTFEDAWFLASQVTLDRELGSRIEAVRRVSLEAKQKDAAGLGALAWAKHEGHPSTSPGIPSGQRARHTANSTVIKSPNQHLETAPSTRDGAPLNLHNTDLPGAEPHPIAQR